MLFPPDPSSRRVSLPAICPSCGTETPLESVHAIRSTAELETFIARGLNRGACARCGSLLEAFVPVLARLSDAAATPHQFVPFAALEDPATLDALLQLDPSVKTVYSLSELGIGVR